MSREVICPACGMRLVLDERTGEPDPDPSSPQATTLEVMLPRTVVADDLGFVNGPSLELPKFDGSDSSRAETSLALSLEIRERPTVEPIFEPTAGSPGAAARESTHRPDTPTTTPAEAARTVHGARPGKPAFLGIKTDSERGLSLSRERGGRSRSRSLGQVALLSYASAMTLACLWMAWQLRSRQADAQPRGLLPTTAVPLDPRGKRGDRGFHVPLAPAIPENRLIAIGQPIEIGALRVTPLEVRSTSVTLELRQNEGGRSVRDGGGGILVLGIRLENLSTDEVFAPLDEAFLREPERGLPDSYIEAADGRIYPYRLPVESDWSIEGQDFRELKPGEVIDTIIASDEGALARASEVMTWRLRLRTGSDPSATEFIGVQFRRDQIQ